MSSLSPNTRGILYMCGAVMILPVMDAISKSLTEGYSPVQIAAVRFGCLLLVLAPLALRHGGQAALRPAGRGMLLLRGLLLSASSVLFVSALAHVPLATAQSITLIFPLIVTALSPWLLGEHVGPVRWAMVGAGFLGALLIIRPGLEPVGAGQLYALACAGVYALYAVLTRRMRGGTGRLTQLFWTVIGALALTGVLAPLDWRAPDMADLGLMALCGVLSGSAHLLIIAAYSEAEATAVVPFSYLQIVFGGMIGYLVWGNLPDALSWAGIVLIAGAGIVVALRSRTPPQIRGAGRV
ncbi:MAG TPA: DMT family transporter [Thermohalobaculum sp.]|nr:DMT family transporter [Thermohalobaculum sp.]